MSYLDRLRTARYISPSGAEFAFKFSDLKRASGKKAPVHEFPQQNDPDVKDLGNIAVRFAIEAYFTGADYDQVADSFWDALSENGPAALLHPRWGDLSVLPIIFNQGEAFVDGMRQATFTIEFVRTGEIQYPTTTVQTEVSLENQISDSQDSASDTFGEQFDPETAAQKAGAVESLTNSIDDFSEKINQIISKNEEIAQEFNRRVSEITSTMDQLILDPVSLGQSYISLFRLPGRVTGKIKEKGHGYKLALKNLKNDAVDIAQSAVQFFQNIAVLLGLSEACLVGDLTTREEAVGVSETLRDAMDTAISNIEIIEGNVSGYAAPADALALTKQIFSDASALMLEKSFSLKITRRIALEGDRTPLDLIYELYGDIDQLDEFIEQNNLQGDELFLIPRGREVAYYG